MNTVNKTGLKVAEFLLQIKAVKLQPNDPFSWASGWRSPIYCDNRLTMSYPEVRTYIRQQFVNVINTHFNAPDVIVGVATGGIGIGALVAEEMGLPFCYVRSSSKGHGLQNQIEGKLNLGDTVVVIEDLISTGGSSLKAVEALRSAGAVVRGMTGIFTYGFPAAEESFKAADVNLITLTDYSTLIQQALESGYIVAADLDKLSEWRKEPARWGKEKIS